MEHEVWLCFHIEQFIYTLQFLSRPESLPGGTVLDYMIASCYN